MLVKRLLNNFTPITILDKKNYLQEAGNIHLSYYVEAADLLGIKYEIIVRSLMARFEYEGAHWFILNTALPVNNVPSSTVAKRKNLTYKVLSSAGIPVAKQLEVENEEQLVDFWKEYKNIVIKPVQNLGGNGVVLLPRTEIEVREGYVHSYDKNLSSTRVQVLAEQFIEGSNYRLLVCDDKVVGAVHRKPAFVTGNGKDTIEDLVMEANSSRKQRLLKPIRLDREVEKKLALEGLDVRSVPEPGREVELRFNSNLSTGGTTEECLDQIDPYYLDLAVKATKAIGLKVGGVDLIARDVTQIDECVINEINYNPGLRLHYKVDRGEEVKVAIPIMKFIAHQISGVEVE